MIKLLNNIKIRSKLFFGFGLVLLITIGISVFAVINLSGLADKIESSNRYLDTFESRTETLSQAIMWGYPVFKEAEALMHYVQSDDPVEQQTLFKDFQNAGAEFLRVNTQVKKSISSSHEEVLIEEIELMQKKLQREAVMLIAIRDGEGEYGEDTKEALKNFKKTSAEFIVKIESLAKLEKSLMNDIKTDARVMSETVQSSINNVSAITIIICFLAVIMGIIVSVFLASTISTQIDESVKFVKKISTGDLTGKAVMKTTDEIGEMISSLNMMTTTLKVFVDEINEVSKGIVDISHETTDTARDLGLGAESQAISIDSLVLNMEEMSLSISESSKNTESVSKKTSEAVSSITEINKSVSGIASFADELSVMVEEVSTSIHELATSIKAVTGHASELTANTAETVESVSQIDLSIREVENIIAATAELSETTAINAQKGGEAVRKTMHGMEDIQLAVEQAAEVIKNLGEKSQAMGFVLKVINEVVDQTGLLSLNASIIAAKAGSHGKGFAVVAEEIKELAQRTVNSTGEIESMLNSVQSETTNVIGLMEKGVEKVRAGVEYSATAGIALEEILKNAESQKEMVKKIDSVSKEQIGASRQANEAMDNISQMLSKMYLAIEDQDKMSSYIAKATEKMTVGARKLKEQTGSQNAEIEVISKAIEGTSDMTQSINITAQEQARGSELALRAIEEIKDIANSNMLNVSKTRDVATTLVDYAGKMDMIAKRFKVEKTKADLTGLDGDGDAIPSDSPDNPAVEKNPGETGLIQES